MNLRQDLEQLQRDAQEKEAEEKRKQRKESAQKAEEEKQRLRGMADEQFPEYIEKLKEAARKHPNSQTLRVSINYHDCYPFAKRLQELFKEEEDMNCDIKESKITDFYGSGYDVKTFSLLFPI